MNRHCDHLSAWLMRRSYRSSSDSGNPIRSDGPHGRRSQTFSSFRQHQRGMSTQGKIGYTRIVGGRIRYTVSDLMAYLTLERQEAED